MARSARTLENIGGGQFALGGRNIGADYGFPSVAQGLGWSLTRVQRDKDGYVVVLGRAPKICSLSHAASSVAGRYVGGKCPACNADFKPRAKLKNYCPHRGTDGSVDCPDCKIKAGDFISAATEYLEQRAGF